MSAKQKPSQRKALRSAAAKKGWETRRINAYWERQTKGWAAGVPLLRAHASEPVPPPTTPYPYPAPDPNPWPRLKAWARKLMGR